MHFDDELSRSLTAPIGVIMRKITTIALVVLALILVRVGTAMIFEGVDADEILVVQDPFDGELHWYTTAGLKWQGFGKVTTYKKRSIYDFNSRIRFNEGGHAMLAGSMQWEMPLAENQLTEIHTRFGSNEAVAKQLIEVVTNKSIYMTGPLLSSTESYAEKRPNLLFWVEDQINHGVYQTTRKDVRMIDPITGEEKTVSVAEISLDSTGVPLRQEAGQLTVFGIRPFNYAVTEITYDDKVERQIQLQQENIMAVQTAMAQARKAEQDALTVEQQGAVKAKAVTEAQQRLEVAQLDAEAAAQERLANIRRGEGDARRRELVMSADGALTQKLEAWLEAQKVWATAVSNYKGSWVPSVVMGGTGQQGNGANDLIDLLTAQTARQLALDMQVPER
jgi:hypothetical protein